MKKSGDSLDKLPPDLRAMLPGLRQPIRVQARAEDENKLRRRIFKQLDEINVASSEQQLERILKELDQLREGVNQLKKSQPKGS